MYYSLKALDCDISRYRDNIIRLGHISDEMTPHMDNATVVLLTSREGTLTQRLSSLQQTLATFTHTAQADSSRQGKFNEAYQLVSAFLDDVKSALARPDPVSGRSSGGGATEQQIRMRVNELKHLSSQFGRKHASLDLLNEIAFRLSLNDANSQRLRTLNAQWAEVAAEAARRHERVQATLLSHEDFDAKLEDWGDFMRQTERDLAADVATNHAALRQQQQAFAVSTSYTVAVPNFLQLWWNRKYIPF